MTIRLCLGLAEKLGCRQRAARTNEPFRAIGAKLEVVAQVLAVRDNDDRVFSVAIYDCTGDDERAFNGVRIAGRVVVAAAPER